MGIRKPKRLITAIEVVKVVLSRVTALMLILCGLRHKYENILCMQGKLVC